MEPKTGRRLGRPGRPDLQRRRPEGCGVPRRRGVFERVRDPSLGDAAAVGVGAPRSPEAEEARLHEAQTPVPVVLFPEGGYELVQRFGQIGVCIVGTFSAPVVVEGESAFDQMLRHGGLPVRIVHKKPEDRVALPGGRGVEPRFQGSPVEGVVAHHDLVEADVIVLQGGGEGVGGRTPVRTGEEALERVDDSAGRAQVLGSVVWTGGWGGCGSQSCGS
mmetsp:Transcript_1595/g.3379  ORF Transcript_1595/g.3379 Transcript_1595/m.3379 type:complete len:218 (+) Transcript_1595:322-975(+)